MSWAATALPWTTTTSRRGLVLTRASLRASVPSIAGCSWTTLTSWAASTTGWAARTTGWTAAATCFTSMALSSSFLRRFGHFGELGELPFAFPLDEASNGNVNTTLKAVLCAVFASLRLLALLSFLLLPLFMSQAHLHLLGGCKKAHLLSGLHGIKTILRFQCAIGIGLDHEIGKFELLNLDRQNQRGCTLFILCIDVSIKSTIAVNIKGVNFLFEFSAAKNNKLQQCSSLAWMSIL